jgi:hypothetical protein
VAVEAVALAEIHRLTKGYPYFLYEWDCQTWNLAKSQPDHHPKSGS